ncbi:hypothetical protein BGZ47_000636 [Haplosporangium gracile]|nr:hypothetical protein BGZ47_000636 [Haplosporangium gracile]
MSALSRIPGVASLVSFVAVTFSLHSNPTLRKYNDLLAHAFYHHGRVCASNQATVMVLVIVFVGMIAYPGIVTSYNSSAYARHRSAIAATTEHDITLSDSFTARHQEANLDTFWAKSVVAPTWSQDPRAFSRSLPSPDPLHYLAPVIINATDHPFQHYTNGALDLDNNSSAEQDSANTPWSEADLFAFTTKIQERIQNIAVQYPPQEDDKSSRHQSTTLPRLITLRDICLLDPAASSSRPEDVDSTAEQSQDSGRRCLVHSPLIYRNDDPTHVGSDIDLDGTLEQYRHKSSLNSLFGGLSLDKDLSPDHRSLSLVITFFLRGDLGVQAPTGHYDDFLATDMTGTGRTHHDPLDVRQIWRLIFKQLQIELQAERTKKAQARLLHHIPITSEKDNSLLSAEEGTEEQEEQDADIDITDVPSSGDSIPDSLSQFLVRALPVQETDQSGSRRLVSEEHAQPRTNISAEYWLLGMAYFVMFLYISLSVGRVDLVKSKYGLGIAAVATVFVSLLMSIGLCSVFGVTLTLMPWEILPFMIIVVGVENINILVHAVVETSMDLPVKERVGRGLSTVGVSITLTLFAELCLLIIGAMTTIPAVQEFCTFAIAAVIMDYLLQMTFFITVISIDIRRLELSDLGRSAAPYSRYPFGSRHSATKSSLFPGDNEMATRFGGIHATNGISMHEGNDSKHRRKDSTESLHSDEDSRAHDKLGNKNRKGRIFTSVILVGVMAYLGYIYGTTNQSTPTMTVTESYWRIIPSEASSEFWTMIDPERQGGYLEIEPPAVLALWRPLNGTHDIPCYTKIDVFELDNCDSQQGASEEAQTGSKQGSKTSQMHASQLDPRRHFKFLWETLVFVCLFAYWLIRVFVIPSITLAASILLLLSYLLSPQRKLLVDLQWSFPFIVLPGDYQSKRKLMMEELLAQEAKELGQDPGACSPLPGSVETLYQRGHKTDIDQMDVSPDQGLILTSSMDGSVLLWSGVAGHGQEMPLSKLEEGVCLKTSPSNKNLPTVRVTAAFTAPAKTPRSKVGSLKCLKLDSSGTFAAGGYADGAVHVWNVDQVAHRYSEQRMGRVPSLRSVHGMVRDPSTTTDQAKLRVCSLYFWEPILRPEAGSFLGEGLTLMAGYRDGQIWQWNPVNGEGQCVAETKHRGGITELAMVELDPKTRQDLGLIQRTYMVAAGRDGGIQCWSISRRQNDSLDIWSMLWGHAGQTAGGSVSVLSLDAEVPMVAVGYSTGAIKVWDLEHGNLVWTLSRGSTVPRASAPNGPSKHLDRRFSQGEPDNHQPSHQGAITKICFHALELEDGLTGEPAPRVWLVISSGVDEAVMVWLVEWEGLMALPTPLGQPTPLCHPTQSGHEYFADYDGAKYGQAQDRIRSNGSREWKSNQGGVLDILGMLSSSLPAPRLVGFMKQRGGRSMTVSNSRLYGVRRTESTTTHTTQLNTPPKQSHVSVAETSRPIGNMIRSRRKSEGHALSSAAAVQDRQATSGGHPTKRGWELWEADLYQCIFKTPGVWGLDLTIRAINLQPPHQRRPSLSARSHLDMTRRPSMAADVFNAVTPGTITVVSNGSGIATQVALNQQHGPHSASDMEFGQQDGSSGQTRPKIQRRPGSFTNQGSQQGYVFTTGLARLSPSGQQPEYGQSLYPTMSGVGGSDDSWGDFRIGGVADDEDSESMLLPFVETRLIHAILRGSSSREAEVETWESMDSAKGPELKDIVIGFGNYIKIVRLMDEDEEILTGDQ